MAANILRANPSGSDWGAGLPGREDAAALNAGLAPPPKASPDIKTANFEERVLRMAGYQHVSADLWEQGYRGEDAPENVDRDPRTGLRRPYGWGEEENEDERYASRVLRVAYGETEAPPAVDTLREEGSAPTPREPFI